MLCPKEKKSYPTKDTVSKIRGCITDTSVSFLIPRGKFHTGGGFSFRAVVHSLPTWIKLFSKRREKEPLALHLTSCLLGTEWTRKGRPVTQ